MAQFFDNVTNYSTNLKALVTSVSHHGVNPGSLALTCPEATPRDYKMPSVPSYVLLWLTDPFNKAEGGTHKFDIPQGNCMILLYSQQWGTEGLAVPTSLRMGSGDDVGRTGPGNRQKAFLSVADIDLIFHSALTEPRSFWGDHLTPPLSLTLWVGIVLL